MIRASDSDTLCASIKLATIVLGVSSSCEALNWAIARPFFLIVVSALNTIWHQVILHKGKHQVAPRIKAGCHIFKCPVRDFRQGVVDSPPPPLDAVAQRRFQQLRTYSF